MTRLLTIIALLFATPAWAQNIRDRGRTFDDGSYSNNEILFGLAFVAAIIAAGYIWQRLKYFRTRDQIIRRGAWLAYQNGYSRDRALSSANDYLKNWGFGEPITEEELVSAVEKKEFEQQGFF